MSRWTRLIVVIGLATMLLLAGCRSTPREGGPPGALHSPAAGFSVQDLDGRPLELASYRGKVVLLNFWATWCAPCRAEIPKFVQLQDSYGPQGFQIVGLSMDDDAKPVREFYQQFKMNYPVAIANEKLAQSYGGIFGLPVSFLIGRDGKIAAKYRGGRPEDLSDIEQQIKALAGAQ